jgi:hypothetical protein
MKYTISTAWEKITRNDDGTASRSDRECIFLDIKIRNVDREKAEQIFHLYDSYFTLYEAEYSSRCEYEIDLGNGSFSEGYAFKRVEGWVGSIKADVAEHCRDLKKIIEYYFDDLNAALADLDEIGNHRDFEEYLAAKEARATQEAADEINSITGRGHIGLRAKANCWIGQKYVKAGTHFLMPVYGDGTKGCPGNAYGELYDFRTAEHAHLFEITERPEATNHTEEENTMSNTNLNQGSTFPVITEEIQREYESQCQARADRTGIPMICGCWGRACRQMNKAEGANRANCQGCPLATYAANPEANQEAPQEIAIDDLRDDLDDGNYGEYLNDYRDSSSYICDAISEIADSHTSIYYSDILAFISEHPDLLGDVIAEGLYDPTHDYDLYKHGQAAEYMMIERDVYDHLADSLFLAALDFLRYDLGRETIPGDLADQIREWCDDADSNDRMDFIPNSIREYFAAEEESA